MVVLTQQGYQELIPIPSAQQAVGVVEDRG